MAEKVLEAFKPDSNRVCKFDGIGQPHVLCCRISAADFQQQMPAVCSVCFTLHRVLFILF